MKNIISKSIKNKLLVFILSLSLLPFIVVIFLNYFSQKETIYATLSNGGTSGVNSKDLAVLYYLKSKTGRALDFSSDGYIKSLLQKINNRKENINSLSKALRNHLIKNKMPLDSDIIEVLVIDSLGIIAASTIESRTGQDIKQDTLFLKGKKDLTIKDIYRSSADNKICFAVCSPIRTSDNKFSGVLAIRYDLKILNKILTVRTNNNIEHAGESFIVNKDGYMVTNSLYIKNAVLNQKVESKLIKLLQTEHKIMVGIYNNYRGISVFGVSGGIETENEFGLGWTILKEINESEAFSSISTLGIISISICLLTALLIILISIAIVRNIVVPIKLIVRGVENIAIGDLDTDIKINTKDEISQLANSFSLMQRRLKDSVKHAIEVAAGNYSKRLEPRSEKDELVIALNKMTTSLEKTEKANQLSNWLKTGQNGLNEKMLGTFNKTNLAKNIINFLVNHLGAKIGAIYFADSNNKKIILLGGYAHDKNIELNKECNFGEGLAGQAAVDKQIITLSDIQDNYFKINSAFGDLIPRNVIVVPLIYNTNVEGIIELGMDKDISDNEIEFLKSVNESIAIAINTTKAQEEKNELLTEVQKKESELAGHIAAINRSNLSVEFDLSGNIIKVNNIFLELFGYKEEEIVGKHHSIFVDGQYKKSAEYKEFWRNLRNGEYLTGEFKRFTKDGESLWIKESYYPVFNNEGKPYKIINIAVDITGQKKAELELLQQVNALGNSAIVSIADKDGNITYANDMFCKISKYSRNELMGKNHRIIKSGKQPDGIFVGMWKSISMGNVWKGEIINKAKDGSFYWVDTIITPFKDINGDIEKYVAVRFDITKQKEQQAILQEQKEELETQQTKLQDAYAELESQAEALKLSEEELKTQQEQIQLANKELERKAILLEEKNQIASEKNLLLEKAKKEIENKVNELAIASKYKSEFLANMSHELRTPLNSILLLSKLLTQNKDSNLTKDQIEYAKVIHNSGNGLLELINEILDLSKIEAGKMDIEFEDIQFKNIGYNLNSLFQPIAEGKGIKFELNLHKALPVSIRTDRMRLEQILKNLLSNAIKFTEIGNVSLNIFSVTDDRIYKNNYLLKNNVIGFSVKDSGIGIPKDKQSLVFEAFQQADGSTKRKFGGTGLGLSISRELANLLGGEINIESEEGQGSTFTLYLPVDCEKANDHLTFKVENNSDIKGKSDKVSEGKSEENLSTSFIPPEIPDDRDNILLNDKVILLVEDDIDFASKLLSFVRDKGYKGIVIVRGDQVLEFAKKFNPFTILLDLQLPVINGLEVLGLLKENENTRRIPVYTMSVHNTKIESRNKGAFDFISKPFDIRKLDNILKKIESFNSKLKKKLLIIEDNETHSEAMVNYLKSDNLNIITANTAKHGMNLLEKDDIDCIILDMGLPDATGFEVLERIKKNSKHNSIPIIIYTGKDLSKEEERKITKYTSTIIIKTANSYERLFDEVTLFLHTMRKEANVQDNLPKKPYIAEKSLENKTVLIADDDMRNVYSLTKILETQGMNVLSGSTGKEALEILQHNKSINIVLMDIMMPEMDGYEAMKKIRNIENFKQLPIIAVTAKAMLGDRKKCLEAGASDYVSKPIDVDQLLSLLRIWLYK